MIEILNFKDVSVDFANRVNTDHLELLKGGKEFGGRSTKHTAKEGSRFTWRKHSASAIHRSGEKRLKNKVRFFK